MRPTFTRSSTLFQDQEFLLTSGPFFFHRLSFSARVSRSFPCGTSFGKVPPPRALTHCALLSLPSRFKLFRVCIPVMICVRAPGLLLSLPPTCSLGAVCSTPGTNFRRHFFLGVVSRQPADLLLNPATAPRFSL